MHAFGNYFIGQTVKRLLKLKFTFILNSSRYRKGQIKLVFTVAISAFSSRIFWLHFSNFGQYSGFEDKEGGFLEAFLS